MFSCLDFLTLEAATNRLSQNVGEELPLHAVWYLRRAQVPHELVMQAFVWLHMVLFRVIWFGVVWFGTLFVNLRWPCIF